MNGIMAIPPPGFNKSCMNDMVLFVDRSRGLACLVCIVMKRSSVWSGGAWEEVVVVVVVVVVRWTGLWSDL